MSSKRILKSLALSALLALAATQAAHASLVVTFSQASNGLTLSFDAYQLEPGEQKLLRMGAP